MVRLFQRHKKRKVFTLDDMWKFKTAPEKRFKAEMVSKFSEGYYPYGCFFMLETMNWDSTVGSVKFK